MRAVIHMPLVALVAFCAGGLVLGQQSASYILEEHTFNAGGHSEGGGILTSASFRISLTSLGDRAAAAGLSSASFQIDSGFTTGYPPPGEVQNLRLLADGETLQWNVEPSIGSYNVYRDLISNLTGLGYGSCEQEARTEEAAIDTDPVPLGEAYFYLVTAENRIAEEGTKGFDSGAMERTGTSCP